MEMNHKMTRYARKVKGKLENFREPREVVNSLLSSIAVIAT